MSKVIPESTHSLHVVQSPGWTGYLVTILLEAALTIGLRLLEPVFPLSSFPITYVLLIMAVAYMFGEGPAILAFVTGFVTFTYFFVYPVHFFWPPAATPVGWARLTAFLLGTLVVGFATIIIRRSTHRIQRLAAVLQDSNTALQAEIVERGRIERELRDSEGRYHSLFSEMSEGFAIHEIVCDASGAPVDYRFLELNPAFERLTGLKIDDAVGKTVREVIPGIEQYWIDAYGKVALTGVPQQFENYSHDLGRHFDVIAYRPAKDQFATLFIDVTEQVNLRKQLEAERDLLQTMMESTNSSFVYLDPQFNFVLVNSTYCRDAGHTREEMIGRNHFEMFPNEENKAIFTQVRDTGVPVEYIAKPFEFADQPWRGVTYWDWTLTPIKDSTGSVQGLVFSLVDVTERIRAQQMSDALNDINAAISSTLDFDEIMQQIVVQSARAIGSESATIAFRENGRWIPRYDCGFPQSIIGTTFSDAELPFAKAAMDAKTAVAIDDTLNDELFVPEVQQKYNIRSVMVVPLIMKEHAIGAIFFNYHSGAVSFSKSQIDFANKLGASASLAVRNARLVNNLHSELDERIQIEETLRESEERQRLVFDSLPAGVFVKDLQGRYTVINRQSEIWMNMTRTQAEGKTDHDLFPCDIADAFRANDEAAIRAGVRIEREEIVPTQDGLRTHLVSRLPLLGAQGQPYALLGIATDITDRKRTEQELAEAKETAEQQLHILQRALIPTKPTVGAGYETASIYIPAYTEQQIGGDFFDVFDTQDGKIGILIGDVSGKGIKAASMAAAARSTVHAFAYESLSTAEALTHANAVLCSQADPDSASFVTMFLAVLDPPTGTLMYASAGHPPAAVYRADGSVELLEQSSLPVGIIEEVQYYEAETLLGHSDKIVLYTDGVSEARHSGQLFGTEGIEAVLRRCGHEPSDHVMGELLTAAKDWGEGRLTDDTAIIVIGRNEPTE